jgi:hypothetical protein
MQGTHKRKRNEDEETVLFNYDMMSIIFRCIFENIHREFHDRVGPEYRNDAIEKARRVWTCINTVCKTWKSFVDRTWSLCFIDTCGRRLKSSMIGECGCRFNQYIIRYKKDRYQCQMCPRMACRSCANKDTPSWTNVIVGCNICCRQMCIHCAKSDKEHMKHSNDNKKICM